MRRNLRVLLGESAEEQPPPPPPPPHAVLYTPPNPDNTRKACQNCVLYVARPARCMIHAEDLQITPAQICGYHVWGEPSQENPWADRPMLPVEPELSGLELVAGGTSCDTCRYYTAVGGAEGRCRAVHTYEPGGPPGGSPALVEPLGCCARWEAVE